MADAGFRLTVEGEREFKKALAEINAQVKTSKSELKLLSAEYEINDDKLGNLNQRQAVLADTMQQQAQKVKLAEERYRAWAAELGEGDVKVLKMKESLNLAQAELAKTTQEWQQNEEAIREYGQQTANVEDTLRQIDAAVEANRSELQLLSAQYKDTGDKSEMYARQNATLENSVQLQRQKIDELTAALRQAEEEYGDGSEAVSKYKKQLADAQTELIGMEEQIEDNNDALEKGGDAADPMKDALSEIANKLGIDIPPGIENMSTKFLGAAVAAGGIGIAVKEGIGMMKEMAAYADDVLTESVISGIDTQVYQQLKYMDGLMDVSTETITSSLSRLKRAMDDAANGSEELERKFGLLGVAVTDQNGNLRDSWDVYLEVIDALGRMNNETERDAAAMDLMGRSAADLNPLIEAGADRMRELADEAQRVGYVLSDDQLAAAGGFQDTIDRLEKQTDALKNNIGQLLIETVRLAEGNTSIDSVKSSWEGLERVVFGLLDTIKGEAGSTESEYGTLGKWLFGQSSAGRIFLDIEKAIGKFKIDYATEEEIIEIEETAKGMEQVAESAEKVAEAEERSAQATEYATKQQERKTEAAQKAYEAEIEAAEEAAEKKIDLYTEELNKELDALDNKHTAELKAVEKNNAAILKAVQKSQKERQKELEAALKEEMALLEAQHKEKLALIDAEYAERLKLLDEDQRDALKEIDDEIAAIEAVTKAEDEAREQQKQKDKIAALEKAVEESETLEDKKKAEEELQDYLLELERERILAEREANIAALEDKKALLEAEFEAQREEIEAEKQATIEGLEAEFEAEKTMMEEQHQQRRDMLSEALSAELDVYRENMSARVDALKEEQKLEREELSKSISERVENFKKEVQKEVDKEAEAAEERLATAKTNAEEMIAIWEDYYIRFKGIFDSGAASARAAGEKIATEYASGLAAAMLAAENNVSYAAGRLTRGALVEGMGNEDMPSIVGAGDYAGALASQLTKASGAFAASRGTGEVIQNYYNVTIDAKNVKEWNDVIRTIDEEKQNIRMGYTGR